MNDEQDDTPLQPSVQQVQVEVDQTLRAAAGRSGLSGWRLAGALAALGGAGVLAWIWLFDAWPARDAAPGARMSFTATAYCKGTMTAAGTAVRRGIAAADRKVLPSGSVVSLSTGDPDFDGVYTVLDTGPAVQGRILDLYVWSCHEALAFGRRKVSATILRLGWDPRDSAPSMTDRLLHRKARRHEPDPEAPVARPQTAPKAAVPAAPSDEGAAADVIPASPPAEEESTVDRSQPAGDAEPPDTP